MVLVQLASGIIRCRCQLHGEIKVASIPTKVHVEIEEVCEPFANFLFIDPCRCTTRQMSEPIKVDRFCAMRAQVRVQESCVTQFMVGSRFRVTSVALW